MIALLRKDFRLFRPAFFAFAAVMVGPYLLGAVISAYNQLLYQNGNSFRLFENCAGIGILGTILLAAIYGGSAFAVERREHWADFLAMMPVSKDQIIASKCFVAFWAIGLAWLTHASIYSYASYYTDYAAITDERIRNYGNQFVIETLYAAYLLTLAAIVLVFGISWFVSALIKSPSISAGIAIILFLTWTFFLQNFLRPAWGWRSTSDALFIVVALPTGFAAFVAGTICYLKRVSP